MKMRNFVYAGMLCFLTCGAAYAQSSPDHADSFKDWLSKNGVSVSYLGQEGGVSGYLAENGNHVQSIYVWPNNHDIVIGQMFNGRGDDVTKSRIAFLSSMKSDSKDELHFPSPEKGEIHGLNPLNIAGMQFAIKNHDIIRQIEYEGDGKNSPIGFIVSAPDKKSVSQTIYVTPNGKMVIAGKHLVFTQAPNGTAQLEPIIDERAVSKAEQKAATKAVEDSLTANKSTSPSAQTDDTQQNGQVQAPVAAVAGNVIESTNGLAPTPIMGPSAEPQEVPMGLFMSEVKGAAWLPIPAKPAPSAATLWFIADPASPATVAVWKQLLPLILAKKLAVHLILVDGSQQSITDNLAILGSKNPGDMWQLIMDGHAPPPIEPGNPSYQRATDWLNDNAAFVKNIRVNATPFLAYMGANMTFVSQLNPPNIGDFLSDLP